MQRFSAKIPRNPTGYRWGDRPDFAADEEAADEGRILKREPLPSDVLKRSREEFVYDPFLEEPALFRDFAKIEPSPDAILRFADQYGDIGGRLGYFGTSFTLADWRKCIAAMRRHIERRDALLKELGKRKPTSEWLKRAAAFTNNVLEGVSVRLFASADEFGVSVKTFCINLWEAMLVQVAASLDERTNYRECDFCGKTFELTPSLNRSDRLFCSDNCRVKAYQRRRKEAIRLRQKGKSLRQIVKATKSDLESVQKWVTDVGAKENENVPKTSRKR
ncbi:MAG TPA: hypothetical protein VMP01_15745 [Pirellulaceae bacterium]|nr:hypothetical protein [Pirellulaceae bacterium]